MPTASRLVAAVILAIAAGLVADLYLENLPREYRPPHIVPGWSLIGLLVGWFTLGGRGAGSSQDSWVVRFNQGIVAGALVLFWGVLIFSIVEMIERSMQKRYRGVEDALTGVFELMGEAGLVIFSLEILLTAAIGGLLAAFLAAWVGRRWK
ncbi:hypothetical protein CLV77_1269 [Brevirhabdus pacifica]|uniref:TrgA family protein n=1 Tax=Brevirhabdus pacifica TaxID=1267768 RepID=UPI0009F9D0E5|nr:TrgA family protein [Brevirhabdus pacifica]PJJ86714.1 hypothetical protein CLV77_1269 [Brevirhabdus pacifica]